MDKTEALQLLEGLLGDAIQSFAARTGLTVTGDRLEFSLVLRSGESSLPVVQGSVGSGSINYAVLSEPVSVLNLSVRSATCLESDRITTIAELALKGAADLLEIRNFGETCLQEVREAMGRFGDWRSLSLFLKQVQPHEFWWQLFDRETPSGLRACKTRVRLNISSLEGFSQKTAKDLAEVKNCGKKTIALISEKLAMYGLKLRTD